MAQVVILYGRNDGREAQRIKKELRSLAFTVESVSVASKDKGNPELKVKGADCVVVIWSNESKGMNRLGTIARAKRGRLVHILIDQIELDAPFNDEPEDTICRLVDWAGSSMDKNWNTALQKIGALTNRPGVAKFNGIRATDNKEDEEDWHNWADANKLDPLAWRAAIQGHSRAISPIEDKYKILRASISDATATAGLKPRRDLAFQPPGATARAARPWLAIFVGLLVLAAALAAQRDFYTKQLTNIRPTVASVTPQGPRSAIDGSAILEDPSRAQLVDGTVFRDCRSCPEMVVVDAPAPGRPNLKLAVTRFEITFAEYSACVRDTNGCVARAQSGGVFDPRVQPIVEVSYRDAAALADWLSIVSHHAYRVPTLDEWKSIALGKPGRAPDWLAHPEAACAHANVDDRNARRDASQFPCADDAMGLTSIGRYQPSASGVFDLFGNAAEWTSTCSTTNSHGCVAMFTIGGSWRSGPEGLDMNSPNSNPIDLRNQFIGIRLVRDLDPH